MNDKNSTIGLMLMMVLLGLYFFVFYPMAQEDANKVRQQQEEQQRTEQRDEQPQISTTPEESVIPDSVRQQELQNSYGPFAGLMDEAVT